MRVKELKAALNVLGPGFDEMDVEVWMPGSTIRLGYDPAGNGIATFLRRGGKLMIEGNVNPGSALDYPNEGAITRD